MESDFYIFDIDKNDSGRIIKLLIGDSPVCKKSQMAWWHSKSVIVMLAEGYTFGKINGKNKSYPNISLKLFIEDEDSGTEDLGFITYDKPETFKNILEDS